MRRILKPQNPEAADRLSREIGIPPALARVMVARGLTDADAGRRHLDPATSPLHDPFEMAGVPEAVERLSATARRGGRVVVFGDYDCDGVGAVAILTTVLKRLGADARAFIPHRLNDGYGLRAETMERAIAEHHPEGIVTVDCGITALEPIRSAVERGLYVIVTDHHLPAAELPKGGVLVDPKLPGCAYPFKDLCGAGIAWKLSEALLIEDGRREGGMGPAERRSWTDSLAKIVALSTIADMVPLVEENRVLTSLGLAGLAQPKSFGLAALLKKSKVAAGRSPTTSEVAFRIVPRLNAAGRIDHASAALELLTTTDRDRAEELAGWLDDANDERRALQERVVGLARSRLLREFDPGRDALIVEAGTPEEGWHRGVLGIAATKIAAEFRRPVLLLSLEGERAAGSGRSWGKTPLHERLSPVAGRWATSFGGHAKALGLTLPSAAWPEFREEARRVFAEARDDDEWVEEIEVDTELVPAEADLRLARDLHRLEPHGMDNPRPVFLVRGLSWDGRGRPVGKNGIRFAFGSPAGRIDAVGWELGALSREERTGTFDVVANLADDRFTGGPSLTVLGLERVA
jgi:single-stranded-DNA-specific exonuclease